ncbi:MAG: polysulfide reductase NrfD [Elusimicrobia bacterium]|nr:polysulfide reductase NrfD [Elusimicrobiota bacterium]
MNSPILAPGHSNKTITDKISSLILTRHTPRAWFLGVAAAFGLMMLLLVSVGWLLVRGLGVWGINVPIAWGFAIINFVWWVGIGHAGTLISAILLLMHQKWRNSINRFAEAMTLFAVACAGLFPALHVGRPWKAFYMFPYPDMMALWPQFRSPLLWDVFAVSTYATVSLLFWFVGLIPDMASMRDQAKNRFIQWFYGLLAMGWRGSARHWQRYESAYLLLAGLATPLVVSVHSVVSFDFAVSQLPGWHSTIFPPYFVAGAVFSGFAMVLTLVIPLRKLYGLGDFITDRHIDLMAKVMLATGLIVAYGYAIETFTDWYSGGVNEIAMIRTRMLGPYAWSYWALMGFNVLLPQTLWVKSIRQNTWALFFIAIGVNVGMWLERFVIVITSLHRGALPSSWGMYTPTVWDWTLFLGSLGLFFSLLFLFIRVLPMISIFEIRQLAAEERHG